MRYSKYSGQFLLLVAATAVCLHCSSLIGQSVNQSVLDSQSINPDNPAPASDENAPGEEYLTRGPLHEAFAEPYDQKVSASVVIKKMPPEAINEVPPDHRPEGDNVFWISGDWAWDDERDDFLWISGVWRKTPPSQRWVPGYWEELDEGYRWVSGFWAGADATELVYLPQPPESLEQGPSSPPPSEDYFYIPGNWIYAENDYQWQPGYWARTQQDWVWSPSQYVWTPRGCIYHQGYWDYGLASRGVVFAPVYYSQTLYQNPGYTYRPRYAIDTGVNLLVHLFVRPNYGQYYFGNYYGAQYSNQYRPWVTNYNQPRSYDPFYSHYQHRQRNQNGNMLSWVENQHQFFQKEERYRPPQTIAAQRKFMEQNQTSNISPAMLRLATFGESFDDVVNEPNRSQQFQSVDQNDLQRITASIDPLRDLSRNRRELERQTRAGRNDIGTQNNLQANGVSNADASRRDGEKGGRRNTLQLPKLEDLQGKTPQASNDFAGKGAESLEAKNRLPRQSEVRNGNESKDDDSATKRKSNGQRMRPDQPKDWPFTNPSGDLGTQDTAKEDRDQNPKINPEAISDVPKGLGGMRDQRGADGRSPANTQDRNNLLKENNRDQENKRSKDDGADVRSALGAERAELAREREQASRGSKPNKLENKQNDAPKQTPPALPNQQSEKGLRTTPPNAALGPKAPGPAIAPKPPAVAPPPAAKLPPPIKGPSAASSLPKASNATLPSPQATTTPSASQSSRKMDRALSPPGNVGQTRNAPAGATAPARQERGSRGGGLPAVGAPNSGAGKASGRAAGNSPKKTAEAPDKK